MNRGKHGSGAAPDPEPLFGRHATDLGAFDLLGFRVIREDSNGLPRPAARFVPAQDDVRSSSPRAPDQFAADVLGAEQRTALVDQNGDLERRIVCVDGRVERRRGPKPRHGAEPRLGRGSGEATAGGPQVEECVAQTWPRSCGQPAALSRQRDVRPANEVRASQRRPRDALHERSSPARHPRRFASSASAGSEQMPGLS